jgi:hypothetical protein
MPFSRALSGLAFVACISSCAETIPECTAPDVRVREAPHFREVRSRLETATVGVPDASVSPPSPAQPDAPFIVSLPVEMGQLFIPDIASSGALVEAFVEVGSEFIGGGIGYANLARAHGVDFDLWFGGFDSAAKLFDARGWRGSLVLPDLDLRLSYFPNQLTTPTWVFGPKTNIVGFRLAKCFGKLAMEMSATAVVGTMVVMIEDVHFGAEVGSHLDLGVAF